MNSPARRQHIPRLCGLLLLLLHLAGQMQVLPLIAAAVAALDGAHSVELANGQDGLCLMLHHDRNGTGDDALPVPHHHRGLLRLLAGADSKGPHPDHRLQFTSSLWELKTVETAMPASEIPHPPVAAGGSRMLLEPAVYASKTERWSPGRRQRWWPPAPAECAWGFVVLLV